MATATERGDALTPDAPCAEWLGGAWVHRLRPDLRQCGAASAEQTRRLMPAKVWEPDYLAIPLSRRRCGAQCPVPTARKLYRHAA